MGNSSSSNVRWRRRLYTPSWRLWPLGWPLLCPKFQFLHRLRMVDTLQIITSNILMFLSTSIMSGATGREMINTIVRSIFHRKTTLLRLSLSGMMLTTDTARCTMTTTTHQGRMSTTISTKSTTNQYTTSQLNQFTNQDCHEDKQKNTSIEFCSNSRGLSKWQMSETQQTLIDTYLVL